MNFKKSTLAACAALSLAAVATQASAYSVLVQPGVSFSGQSGAALIDFGVSGGGPLVSGLAGSGDVVASGTAGGLGYSFTDGALYNTSVGGVTARPGGTSLGNFWSIGDTPSAQNGPGVLTFGGLGALYVGFMWGSVDSYNQVEVWSGATLLGSYGGSFVTSPANGNQSPLGTAYFNVSTTSPQAITKMVFTSTGTPTGVAKNAFETDNFAVTAVPEPETYAMLLAGLGLIGTIARRRNQSKSV